MTYVNAAAAQKRVPLSNGQRQEWNSFLDYLQKRGVKGNPALDNRDTGLGQKLMEEYRAQNPHFSLTYDQVPQVQQDLQDYRNSLVQQYKSGKAAVTPDIKSADDIMPDLSPADGWLGSKTSSHKYPVATLNNNGTVQNYGTNISAYDAAMANIKNGK